MDCVWVEFMVYIKMVKILMGKLEIVIIIVLKLNNYDMLWLL